jgi:RNA polymerase sigma factor (sigma-70 family)
VCSRDLASQAVPDIMGFPDGELRSARPSAAMSASDPGFRELMRQLQAGSDDAAMRLLELYGPHVFRVVRRRLARELRPRFDSADFVQAVWASFFANIDRVAHFESPERLIAYLSGIASKKVIDEVRRRLVYKRQNIHREVRLCASHDSVGLPRVLACKDPTPSENAIANEQRELALLDQPSHHRRMIEMRIAGARCVDIARLLGVHERTVRRVIGRLSKRMQRCHSN